jgi:hypothetical protein
MRLRINAPRIALEQIEGETIIIDFDSGAYFSIGSIGSELVQRVMQGFTVDEVSQYAVDRYSGPAAEIERSVRDFFQKLQRESILMKAGENLSSPSEPLPPPLPERPTFEAPVLNKYTDMKDLLLLDPIHEVDEHGWPVRKPDA